MSKDTIDIINHCSNCIVYEKEKDRLLEISDSIFDAIFDMETFCQKCFDAGCKKVEVTNVD